MDIESEAIDIASEEMSRLLAESYARLKTEILSETADIDKIIELANEVNNITHLIAGEDEDTYEAWKIHLFVSGKNNLSVVTGYELPLE